MAAEAVAVPAHGTLTRYNLHGCRCPDCRAANRSYSADYRAQIRAHGAISPGWRNALHQAGDNND